MTYRLDWLAQRFKTRVTAYEHEFNPWDRGLHATRVYREDSLSVVEKRAEIIKRTVEHLEPIVLEEGWIQGHSFQNYPVHTGVNEDHLWKFAAAFPEFGGVSLDWPLPGNVKQEYRFWLDHSPIAKNRLREQYRWIYRYNLASPFGTIAGHTLPDHGILLQNGVSLLQTGLRARLAEETNRPGIEQFTAMDQCLQALARLCMKYSEALYQKAEEATDSGLRGRLKVQADSMVHISSQAPANLHQALQLLYFSHFLDQLDTKGDAASFGRVDQLLYPFYQGDLASGLVTENSARDLITHFIIKVWKPQSSCNITVGGLRPQGDDGVNPLSYMLLQAMDAADLAVDMTVRVHSGTPPSFLETAIRVVRRGFGRPSFYNDDVAIDALVNSGVEPADARDYAPLGCAEIMIPGKTNFRTMGLNYQPLKVLELVLHQGCCLVTGEHMFVDIPARYRTMDELMEVYHQKAAEVLDCALQVSEEDERLEPLISPRPWLSVLTHGGLETGVDVTAGLPKYNSCGKTMASVVDISNSLYALRRLVYEDKTLTLEELREILAANWEDHEPLRQYVLHQLPRFGQDHKEVNQVARDEAAFFASCLRGRRPFWGDRYWPMIFGLSYLHRDSMIGASPCGRRANEPVSATLQPTTNKLGYTISQLLNSVAAIDFTEYAGGVSNVQSLDPALFVGDEGLERLAQVVKTFFQQGGMELGINLVSTEMLEEARQKPEVYGGLMVRLFGLSAQFVGLSADVQDAVIERVRRL